MNSLETALHRVGRDMERSGYSWALVGGLAVSTRAEPRFTADVDVVVAVDDDRAAERFVRGMLADGYSLLQAFDHDSGRLALARMTLPLDDVDVTIDLMFASSGIEREIAQAADVLGATAGLRLPVARSGHLIALKVLARDDEMRPQDLADLHALLETADTGDLALARESVALIEARGFHRGRDLRKALDDLVRRHQAAPGPR
jgi:hypothetical protein